MTLSAWREISSGYAPGHAYTSRQQAPVFRLLLQLGPPVHQAFYHESNAPCFYHHRQHRWTSAGVCQKELPHLLHQFPHHLNLLPSHLGNQNKCSIPFHSDTQVLHL